MSNKFVFLLGNPGDKYRFTRHNIAWLFVDHYLEQVEKMSPAWASKFKGQYCTLDGKGHKIFFVKPETYMNLSGECVVRFVQFFKASLEDILVVHDEIDLDYGTIMYKKGGGTAGHNGLKSIHQCLGNPGFNRLRLGVSRPEDSRFDIARWVLAGFDKIESSLLEDYFEFAAKSFNYYLKNGFAKTANQYNKKNFRN